MRPLGPLPAALAELGDAALAHVREGAPEALQPRLDAVLDDSECLHAVRAVFATSDFVAAAASARPEPFVEFLEQRRFEAPFGAEVLERLVRERLEPASDIAALTAALRDIRQQAQVHIVWRDFLAGDYRETVAATTLLADRLIEASLDRLHEWLVERMGQPRAMDGTPQRLVVFALGKLGAEELNLSSDVDLIFAYPEAGTLEGSDKANQAFFLRLGQQLVQVLDNVTGDGFAFRVDMRLRPYGDSGALVLHFAAMERYYEEQGRGWERYALIRARVCAGDRQRGAELLRALRPFVYRRYLDFGAIDALREMRERVDRERSAKELKSNIKLGPGGIRDVEFVVQMRQLTWGGRHPELQVPRTLDAIRRMVEMRLIEADAAEVLERGYVFLRDAEHKLQGIADEQTQTLPMDQRDRARLAYLMGFAAYDAFCARLEEHRHAIAEVFAELVHHGKAEGNSRWHRLWDAEDAALTDHFARLDLDDPEAAVAAITSLRAARDRPMIGQEGRDRLNRLMPELLEGVFATAHPGRALERVVPLLEAVLRRSAYLVLLDENPGALAVLLEICASSRWMASELARHPALLDDLLDERGLFILPTREDLAAELAARLEHCTDAESSQEALSAFKQSHSFRCAACQLRGSLPLMNVSDYLTFLAEVVLQAALDLAWEATAAELAEPVAGQRPFVIVGYGKLGGLELGPDSDLDVVFIHDLAPEAGRFLHRMVRRLMTLLTAQTYSGAMYEVDIRLRPDGRSGLMVTSLSGFEQYQQRDAWVWEQQALVRARPVAGHAGLAARFVALRQALLCERRERSVVRDAVVDMRRRIEGAAADDADLKRGAGGIVDIEFMVQYLVLAWAFEHPSLCEFTDNVRILAAAAQVGLLSEAQRSLLTDAYLALRAERHRAALDIADDERAREVLERHRDGVRGVWDELLGT